MSSVKRVYLTKGGINKTIDGDNCYKRCGLLIGNKIHWLDFYFSSFHEISRQLRSLNIYLDPSLKSFRFLEHGEYNNFSDDDIYYPVTKINKPNWQVFDPKSSYWQRTLLTDDGKRGLWTIDEIKSKYLTGELQ